MNEQDFERIWARVGTHAGEEFHTVRGIAFTYRVDGNSVWLNDRSSDHSGQHRSEWLKAVDRMPVDGPSKLGGDIWGATYIYAVLRDRRVGPEQWWS
jgi:hypothetical protein